MAITRVVAPPPTLKGYRIATLFLEPEIRPGDTVFVDTAATPMDGDLVVTLQNSSSFLGRYHTDKKGSWVETATGRFTPNKVTIYGVVTGCEHVFRRT
ncbi:S24 family peptidase [Candidatus Magnetobacterium casense]|uniref:S24 family peptidase n=1 Tax=Candidatus Magnetobacterium casense TaxID=1455061 RepID=A0ABS6S300_9BACT|nr:S24 family peptidase [Candidatus Magnetobacterium casensis]MBV6343232.1 S24 family peptidase [Candidatus Magnetobacterium casensis]